MLRLREVAGGYGEGRTVIEGISIEIAAGETVAILGANTAGKTTLIRAIAGQLPVVKGEVTFEGASLAGVPSHGRCRVGIACVPEGRHIFSTMSVEENLLMGAYHRRHQPIEDDIEACFALFPRLLERRIQPAGTLSGGEQQMVAICRALMAAPRILLMDEPSHGLAPMLVTEVHGAIRKINKRGVSVLLVEQSVKNALKVASRGYVLMSGRIAISGTAGELEANDDVRRTYLGI